MIWGLLAVSMFWFAFGFVFARSRPHRSRFRIEIGQSHDGGRPLYNTISVRVRDRADCVIAYERINMAEDDWEEKLAIAMSKMKQKRRSIEAANKIARER